MNLRFIGMAAVLFLGVLLGYIVGRGLEKTEVLAKRIMIFVMVFLSWPILFFVVWKMDLSLQLIYLPVICSFMMIIMTGLSAVVFFIHKLPFDSHATITLAGGLNNMGYTGGGFVCYALFGLAGLGISQIYIIAFPIITFMILVPTIKVIQAKALKSTLSVSKIIFDYRLISVPIIIFALLLNLLNTKPPEWIFTFHLIDILIYTAAALAFFAIGIRVTLTHLRNFINLYLTLAAVKFLLAPLVALILMYILKLMGNELQSLSRNVVLVQVLSPTAVAMVVLANIFDLDSRLASAVWVANTAIFIVVVMPILYFVFM